MESTSPPHFLKSLPLYYCWLHAGSSVKHRKLVTFHTLPLLFLALFSQFTFLHMHFCYSTHHTPLQESTHSSMCPTQHVGSPGVLPALLWTSCLSDPGIPPAYHHFSLVLFLNYISQWHHTLGWRAQLCLVMSPPEPAGAPVLSTGQPLASSHRYHPPNPSIVKTHR